jgi:hypothetical protein
MKSGEMSIAEQTILSELNDFIRRRKNWLWVLAIYFWTYIPKRSQWTESRGSTFLRSRALNGVILTRLCCLQSQRNVGSLKRECYFWRGWRVVMIVLQFERSHQQFLNKADRSISPLSHPLFPQSWTNSSLDG